MKEKIKEGVKRILTNLRFSGAVVGIVGFGLVINVLEILFVWGAGLAMVGLGFNLIFVEGSVFLGLVVLFIGTPIAVGIASFLFPFWVILLIFGLIVVLFRWIF